MIITINGTPGSGKSTIADYLAKKLKLKRYSMGDFRRNLAIEMNMTIGELNKLGENEYWTDRKADEYQAKLAKKENNFVIDGRLSWYFIPKSIKLFVKSDIEKASERIFKAKRKSEKSYKNSKEVLNELKNRIKSDVRRYRKYYGINNVYDISNYDIIIDTSCLTVDEMNIEALKAVKSFKKM